jgi:hypothetical protein
MLDLIFDLWYIGDFIKCVYRTFTGKATLGEKILTWVFLGIVLMAVIIIGWIISISQFFYIPS